MDLSLLDCEFHTCFPLLTAPLPLGRIGFLKLAGIGTFPSSQASWALIKILAGYSLVKQFLLRAELAKNRTLWHIPQWFHHISMQKVQADSPPVSLQWEPVQAQDVKLKKAIVSFEGFHSQTCPPWTTSNSLVFFQLCLTSDWFLWRLLLVGFSSSKLWFAYLPVSPVWDGRYVVVCPVILLLLQI